MALSQEEVAHLLGTETGEKVCRHERFLREPELRTALAYEVIFRRTVSEIFAGLYQQVEQEVAARARTLVSRSNRRKLNRRNARKGQTLLEIAALESRRPVNQA